VQNAIKGFEETYKNLGIKFDVCLYENEFKNEGKKIAGELLNKGFGFEHDGSVVIDLEKYGLPNTVLVRSDKTSLYLTSDLALTVYKFKKFKLNESIWVVGSEQNLHFKQLFKILEILGYKWATNCKHMNYGIVTLHGSKMSSRSGEYILLDDLVDEIIEKGIEEVNKRNSGLSEDKIKEISKKIGIGALKYDILKVDRNKNVDFNPSKAIKFEGDTGPYLQYTIVRCNSILRNINKKRKIEIKEINNYEKELLKKFLEFSEVIERSNENMRPNLICNYAFELATSFSKFYENCKVIGDKEEGFRLGLVKKTKEVLEICLGLLGIEVPDKM
jgi:arginyl-tRNA synthetase